MGRAKRESLGYKFYSDARHGWLAVKRQELIDLGIAKTISYYSYERGQTVFLEEDCDMLRFMSAYESRKGVKVKILSVDAGDRSPIRGCQRYQVAL